MKNRGLKYYVCIYVLTALILSGFLSEAQIVRIDHVLIAVDNLDSAKFEYEQNGFNVVYGGTKRKSLNALIFLKDGTVIELIGKDRFPWYYTILNKVGISKLFGLMKDRITKFRKAPDGLFNYCLYSTDLDSTYKNLKANLIKCDKPKQLNRKRDDGIVIKWSLIGTCPYDLPFYINDYSPSRVSDSLLLEHQNGVIGIDSLDVVTNQFESYLKLYNLIYNQSPIVNGSVGLRYARYHLKGQTLILKESVESFVTFNRKECSMPVMVYLSKRYGNQQFKKRINTYLNL